MERLTAWEDGHAYFPECFKEPCNGCGCVKENCDFLESVCRRLAEYEDTDHTPSMVRSLKRSEVNAHKTAIQHATKLADYENIGTLEECKEAVEKQKAKEPSYDGDGYAPDGSFVWDEWLCPCCGARFEVDYEEHDYCPNCGQHILWEERDEQ